MPRMEFLSQWASKRGMACNLEDKILDKVLENHVVNKEIIMTLSMQRRMCSGWMVDMNSSKTDG